MSGPAPDWKKRILIPLWIVRICAMLFMIAAFAWAVKEVRKYGTERSAAAIAIYLSFMIVVVLLDIVEMIMFFCHKLTPLPFLTMSSFQAGFWSGASLMEIVYIGKFGTSAGGLGVSVFLFILYFATLIYAAIGYHRARKQRNLGKYAPAHNPASPDHDHDLPAYNGYSVPNQNTAYQSPYTIPHPNQDAATGYYTEAPTKPAAIV